MRIRHCTSVQKGYAMSPLDDRPCEDFSSRDKHGTEKAARQAEIDPKSASEVLEDEAAIARWISEGNPNCGDF